jgi:hypothetical protein
VRGPGPIVRLIVLILGVGLIGAATGCLVGILTPAHVEIAGTDAQVELRIGQTQDEAVLSGDLLTARRPTSRSVLGEPVGVTVALHLDPSTFVAPDGSFNADVIPVYIQAFSDPAQTRSDIVRAVVRHLLLWATVGTVVAVALSLLTKLARRWRNLQLELIEADTGRRLAPYFTAQRRVLRLAAIGVIVLVVLMLVPSAAPLRRPEREPRPEALLAGTPFAGLEVGGLLRPALVAVRNYIATYFSDTNSYYDELRTTVRSELDRQAVTLPQGPELEHFLYVTDRHCNIGMDRVIVALAQHFHISVLVSGGDDDFSGSFSFEAACTRNLAEKSQRAGMTDVFVAGNHDSQLTLDAERQQHIKVLDRSAVEVDGLTFVGAPDPRTSRYGQGIRPSSSAAQLRLVTAQGASTADIACSTAPPVIAVLHDPAAGETALTDGCGHALLALDGHTHKQAGPTPVPVANGSTGYRFVGGSAGGAPYGESTSQSFTSALTVGPLNHDASLNIVTVDKTTGALAGITVCRITPDQTVTFEQFAPT